MKVINKKRQRFSWINLNTLMKLINQFILVWILSLFDDSMLKSLIYKLNSERKEDKIEAVYF